jgi:DNA-binding transcriptional regulator YhcF (GntR family)
MEMAIMLNVSRETVTRVFQKLQGREIVRKNGTKKLEVLQVQLLGELAEGGIEL